MLTGHPLTTFIFAHANVDAPACFAERLLGTYTNVVIDLAGRVDPGGQRLNDPVFASSRIIDGQGALLAAWRDVIEWFPHRILFGLDVGPPVNRYVYLADLVTQWRATLAQVSAGAGEKVAHANAQQLMARCTDEGREALTAGRWAAVRARAAPAAESAPRATAWRAVLRAPALVRPAARPGSRSAGR